jgi:hypothetical protein
MCWPADWIGSSSARVKRGVMAAIETPAWQDLCAGNHGKLDIAVTALLARGQAEGGIREGVDAADVILLLGGLGLPRFDGQGQ